MQLLKVINPENVSESESETYPVREAVRAVVIDNEGKVALLHVSRDKYYKIPGGGIEGTEDKFLALKRECMEEIGSEIDVLGEIGAIVEYRRLFNLKQISYCYFAKLNGDKGTPNFMEDEIEEGFEVMWVSFEEALKLLSKNGATNVEGSQYIVPRDLTFVKASERFIRSNF